MTTQTYSLTAEETGSHFTSQDENTDDEPISIMASSSILMEEQPTEEMSDEGEQHDDFDDVDETVGLSQQRNQQRINNRATYTDINGLLLYLDPNVTTPTIRFRLSEERHAHNRCMSNLYFILIYLLLRLWLEAFLTKTITLYAICGVGTLWLFYSLYKRRRNWDMELLYRMEALMDLAGRGNDEIQFGGEGSYRDMIEGVSENNRSKWVRFVYREGSDESNTLLQSRQRDYGSVECQSSESKYENFIDVEADPNDKKSRQRDYGSVECQSSESKYDNFIDVEADPNDKEICSICLCEYEDGDRVVVLPCSHIYHEDCITPWTERHTKCPLCNFNLESNER